jgi:hypothetical protein
LITLLESKTVPKMNQRRTLVPKNFKIEAKLAGGSREEVFVLVPEMGN